MLSQIPIGRLRAWTYSSFTRAVCICAFSGHRYSTAMRLCELSVHIPVKQKTQQSIDEESVPTVPLQQDKEMPWTE